MTNRPTGSGFLTEATGVPYAGPIRSDLTAFGIYLPEAHGAVGDGTTNDTTAVQAALTAASAGNTVYLSKKYYVPQGVTLPKQLKLVGLSGGSLSAAYGCGLTTDSTTVTALTITGAGWTLRDFAVVNTATTPTAGAGIDAQTAEFGTMDNLFVSGFYNGVQTNNGEYYNIDKCKIVDHVNYCLYLRNTTNVDNGDMVVSNNLLGGYFNGSRTPVAAVRWESAGGLRFTGNKINGGVTASGGTHGSVGTGIQCFIADGDSTTNLIFTGNTIEAWNTGGIDIQQLGGSNTGQVGNIIIGDNEIVGNSGTAIAIHPTASGLNFANISVGNNVLGGCGTGILLGNCSNVAIGPNTYYSVSGTMISIASGVANYSVDWPRQMVTGDNIVLLGSNADNPGSTTTIGQSKYEFARELIATASTSVYTGLYRVSIPPFGSGKITATWSANQHAAGQTAYSSTILYTRGASGAVTATVQGTDLTIGITLDTLWDVSTVSGEIRPSYRLHSGAGANGIDGRFSMTIEGSTSGVKKGV